jgi:hypothetical protein
MVELPRLPDRELLAVVRVTEAAFDLDAMLARFDMLWGTNR